MTHFLIKLTIIRYDSPSSHVIPCAFFQTLNVNDKPTHTCPNNVYIMCITAHFYHKYFEKSTRALDLASIPVLTCQHFWQHIACHTVVVTLFRILWGMFRIRQRNRQGCEENLKTMATCPFHKTG